jgi:hypothetical protein
MALSAIMAHAVTPVAGAIRATIPPMNNRAAVVQFWIWCVVLATASRYAVAQVSTNPEETSSCRQFAQAFYDWYVPFTQKRMNGPASDIALKRKADMFSQELLRALKIDSGAQARAKGELVGIDFDPFVGSQDPAGHYEVRRVTWRGDRCSVEVWPASPTDTAAKSEKPDVVAELVQEKGHWQFLNFHYPDLKADLIGVLAQLREDRRKQ